MKGACVRMGSVGNQDISFLAVLGTGVRGRSSSYLNIQATQTFFGKERLACKKLRSIPMKIADIHRRQRKIA
jgi:hypothetical protein